MAKIKKSGLGRGLDAILGDVELAYSKELEKGKKELILEIDVSRIKPNPYQPRTTFDEKAIKELSESIKRHGLIQPIIVFQKDDDYILIAGERRLRAVKLLGLKNIKAIVADIESKNLRELALIENIQRQDLTPLELATSYKELIDEYKITQDDLAEIIKKSRSQITNTLRLLSLSQDTKKALEEGKITQGHAKVLIGLSSKDETEVLNTIIGQKLNVRQTESLVKKIKNQDLDKKDKTEEKYKDFHHEMDELKTKFKNFGFNRIKIKNNKISIEFEEIAEIKKLISKFN
ncbi:chromosome partitioning protein [Campylobacter blaseri]|uniref:Chromosome partitioning protein ParB n=1 Tax=Campylobacter blaseri TaxID=2042961 RepID=A0A2P8QZC5_9BACT|nr:ParB/RepB/Spo0J family partition protein [Campylobacter blaseri]PSM51604.1 chromosome partitioning protein ParB [Campylobacter blaseri]PSM53397.1 chromosome partitioning protein ParB [Campylobacter blaseri]QKF86693.1 chromosome partitioning protein [Campylobacter blaseri]